MSSGRSGSERQLRVVVFGYQRLRPRIRGPLHLGTASGCTFGVLVPYRTVRCSQRTLASWNDCGFAGEGMLYRHGRGVSPSYPGSTPRGGGDAGRGVNRQIWASDWDAVEGGRCMKVLITGGAG